MKAKKNASAKTQFPYNEIAVPRKGVGAEAQTLVLGFPESVHEVEKESGRLIWGLWNEFCETLKKADDSTLWSMEGLSQAVAAVKKLVGAEGAPTVGEMLVSLAGYKLGLLDGTRSARMDAVSSSLERVAKKLSGAFDDKEEEESEPEGVFASTDLSEPVEFDHDADNVWNAVGWESSKELGIDDIIDPALRRSQNRSRIIEEVLKGVVGQFEGGGEITHRDTLMCIIGHEVGSKIMAGSVMPSQLISMLAGGKSSLLQ